MPIMFYMHNVLIKIWFVILTENLKTKLTNTYIIYILSSIKLSYRYLSIIGLFQYNVNKYLFPLVREQQRNNV